VIALANPIEFSSLRVEPCQGKAAGVTMNNHRTYLSDQIAYVRRRGILLGGIALLVCVLLTSAISIGQSSVAPACTDSSRIAHIATLTTSLPPFATRRDSPTLLAFMYSRYEQTRETVLGYECSGVPLIALDGQKWRPTAKADDFGIDYFVAEIVRFTHVDLNRAIEIFFVLLLTISFGSGIVGVFFWIEGTVSRIAAIIGVTCLALATAVVGDIYMVQSGIVVAVVPWALYFARLSNPGTGVVLFAFLAGFGAALANVIRFHAGTAILLFLAALLLLACRAPLWHRALVAALAIAGFIMPVVYFQVLVNRRDATLEKLDATYKPIVPHHQFWHTVYIGFGFLDNEYGLKFQDEIADAKARSIEPGVDYVSRDYERILRAEVFRFIKAHPRFVFETFAAKTGMLFIMLLVCANLGLPSALLYPKPWSVEAAFWLALAFTATQGLLAVPSPDYLLGYMAFAVFYGILGIDFALVHGVVPSRERARG